MDNNSDDVDIEEFIKEFLDLTQLVLEEDYRQRGIDIKLPNRNVPPSGEGSDFDPVVIMRRIRVIEKGIKAGKIKLMFQELEKFKSAGSFHPPESQIPIHEPITEADVELFEIWLSTLVAKDRSWLNELSLLKLTKNGDLRTAKLIEDEPELILKSLRYEMMRSNLGAIRFIQKEAAKMDANFFQRLGKILSKPGIGFEHSESKPHNFLLLHWATYRKHTEGKVIPPLCYFSDPALAMYVEINLKCLPISPGKIRKIWERLGLHKAKHLEVKDFEKRQGKTIFSWTPK